jgi:orotate phosphoribosyltransferase
MNERTLHKSQLIDFLITSKALSFGEFLLKSGRTAPYFINTGAFDDGKKITTLGAFYANYIHALGWDTVDVIFGPAYKGIPLCVATTIALAQNFDTNLGFCFNRKEAKTRGEGGEFVGTKLSAGMRAIIVEDVVTAGTTLQEVIPLLRETIGVEIQGVAIMVDREERGLGELSAVQETEASLGVPIRSMVTIRDILDYLSHPNNSGFQIDKALQERIDAYRAMYGVV